MTPRPQKSLHHRMIPVVLLLALAAAGVFFRPSPTVNKNDPELRTINGLLLHHNNSFTGQVVSFYDNEKRESLWHYRRGLVHGEVLFWHANGRVASQRFYTNGQKSGTHRGWHPNGKMAFRATFKDGVYHGFARSWYASGQPQAAFYFMHGQEDGPQRAWRENGKLYANYTVKEGRKYGLYNPRLCFKLNPNGQN